MTLEEAAKIKALFSQRLQALLKENNMTQVELSRMLGVSESTIGKWILEKSLPRMVIVEKLANIFNRPKSYFFDETKVIKMGIGDKLQKLITAKNTNVNELAARAKVAPSTLYSIIKRDNTKADIDVLIRIAKVLGVSVEYFSDEGTQTYYLNSETAKLAQEIYENPDLRILLDTSKKLSPEDVQFISNMVKRLKQKECGGDEDC